MIRYTDTDFVGSIDHRMRTSGYVFSFGSGSVAWESNKHPIVTLYSIEVEYVVATTAACQTVWIRRTLSELQHEQNKPTQIFYDNKFVIAL